MKYVTTSYNPEHYHTRKDCPYFPDVWTPYDEQHDRRDLRKCDECSLLEFKSQLAQQ